MKPRAIFRVLKPFFTAVCLSACFSVFSSCDLLFEGNPGRNGTVTINFDGDSRAVITDNEVQDILYYVLTFVREDGQTVTETVKQGVKSATISLAPGAWHVSAEAHFAGGLLAGTGEADTTVKAGAAAAVSIRMNLSSGLAGAILIHNAEELRRIDASGYDDIYTLGAKYQLVADITVNNWNPIGTPSDPFYGEFNGNGRTITINGIVPVFETEDYAGLFGYVEGSSSTVRAKISNLRLSVTASIPSPSGDLNIGAVAGSAKWADFSGVYTSGSINIPSSANRIYIGGVAGKIDICTIENSSSLAALSTTSTTTTKEIYAGGIAGYIAGAGGITNCSSGSTVTANSDYRVYAGGIAGYIASGAGNIRDSYATGDITGELDANGSSYYAGGIVGQAGGSGSIEACYATGDVTITCVTGTVNAGGVAGSSQINVLRCFALGNVKADTGSSAIPSVGGIVGNATGSSVSITNCYARGKVTGNGTGDVNIGGIAGYSIEPITKCYATGAVESLADDKYVGGILGRIVGTTVTYCAALNSSLINPENTSNMHRIVGNSGSGASYNVAISTMTFNPSYDPPDNTAENGDTMTSLAAAVAWMKTTGGWDFNGTWADGPDGYPVLTGVGQ